MRKHWFEHKACTPEPLLLLLSAVLLLLVKRLQQLCFPPAAQLHFYESQAMLHKSQNTVL
jgi:hypothetical protein